MTRSVYFDVLDNLRDSASRGQHAHVIQETFAIDDELQNLQLHLLDIRARSYVACAEFAKALETATTMQQMNPASALGYLCQGYIHMEQGRHTAAAHLYETALECVDKSDDLYETIKTCKDKATQQGEKQRDFICDFPMDISTRIIHEMFFEEYYNQQREYVMVSWAWWRRIMATNHFEFSLDSDKALAETTDMVIQSFNHVRSLTYYSWGPTFNHLLEKHPFTSLTKLRVMGATPEETIAALRLIGRQLTRFIYQFDSMIRLNDILTTCPNLVSFNCGSTIDISGLKDTHSKLRSLKIYTVAGTVDDQIMMTLKQHLPGLRILNMAIKGSSRPLTVDDPWIPAIRHLAYGNHPSIYHQTLEFQEYEEQGLVTFSITPTSHPFALGDIAPLIIHHHATLQLLELRSHSLNMTRTDNMGDAMKNYRQAEFTRLTKLVVYTLQEDIHMQSYANFIAWIIQRAPYLQEITLHGRIMTTHPLKAMAKCDYLRSVYFNTYPTQRPEDYDTLVAEFVRDHVNHMADKGGSRLETIEFRLHKAEPMLIQAIRGLKSLQMVQLSTNTLAPEPFLWLFKSLRQGCPRLKVLHIENHGVMPNGVLYQISGLANLMDLSISGYMKESQAGVLSLQRCRHLRYLSSTNLIDEDVQCMIREAIPGCRIMVPHTYSPLVTQ